MKNYGASLAIFLLTFIVTFPVHAAVVINEVVPKTDPSTWEWVELYNTDGSQSVNLDRWKLAHTADSSSYILNAAAKIDPHGFLLLTGSQTAISFNIYGDTVQLFNQNDSLVDSVSYPGTLGYATSIGRSPDGSDGWVVCSPDPYKATPNVPNNCPPAPAPTSTPTPTPQPKADRPLADTPTPYPTATAYPTPTPLLASGGAVPTQQTFGSLITTPTGTQVLGATNGITPTPKNPDVLQFKIDKMWIVYTLMAMAAAALALMLSMWIKQRQIRKKV